MNIGLMVIDMQWTFPVARRESLKLNVRKEIALAKRRNAPIILVEYEDSGPTLPELLRTLNGYEHCYKITKNDDDGSTEILGVLAELPRFVPKWRICGIHLEHCVWDTIMGLKNNLKKTKLEIVRKGVSSMPNKSKTNLLSTLKTKGFIIR